MSGTIMGSCLFCSVCLLHCWPTLVFLLLPCRLSNAFLKVLTVSTLFTMLGREFHGSVTLTDQKFLLISPFPCFGITLRCPVECLMDASPSLGWQNWNQVAGEIILHLITLFYWTKMMIITVLICFLGRVNITSIQNNWCYFFMDN